MNNFNPSITVLNDNNWITTWKSSLLVCQHELKADENIVVNQYTTEDCKKERDLNRINPKVTVLNYYNHYRIICLITLINSICYQSSLKVN